ncbi:MAG: hypothetical protein JSV96_02850 [Candidatus Aminicenantes bacterium]|nr:MAG: hypothetical protein JSV96_02850 [Candidatus Aminicenantes bacterium]
MWGNWRFDSEENSLIVSKSLCPGEEEKDLYKVDLERCNSSAAILDWIVQISQKLWITREDIGYLVEALDEIFSLQSNFCGSEFEHSDGRPDYAKRILENRF